MSSPQSLAKSLVRLARSLTKAAAELERPSKRARVRSRRERLLGYIRRHSRSVFTQAELRRAHPDIKPNTIQGAVHRFKKSGVIDVVSRGHYRYRRG